MKDVRRLMTAALLLVLLTACAPGGGNAPSPYGGTNAPVAPAAATPTSAPKAAPLATPLPSGTMDDPYGYGY